MTEPPPRRPRYTRERWLETSIEVLARDGIGGVTIERLASMLGVTRGSFYHHFTDREDLLRTILDYWAQELTVRVCDEVRSLHLDPRTSLLALMRMIRSRKAASYDVAIRGWALRDPMAQRVVRETDEVRLEFARELFRGMGYDGLDVENRSRLFLYYEMTEPSACHGQSPELLSELLEKRHAFLTAEAPSGVSRDVSFGRALSRSPSRAGTAE